MIIHRSKISSCSEKIQPPLHPIRNSDKERHLKPVAAPLKKLTKFPPFPQLKENTVSEAYFLFLGRLAKYALTFLSILKFLQFIGKLLNVLLEFSLITIHVHVFLYRHS